MWRANSLKTSRQNELNSVRQHKHRAGQLALEEWNQTHTGKLRDEAIQKSQAVVTGQVTKQTVNALLNAVAKKLQR